MNCYSPSELRSYVLGDLPSQLERQVEQHVAGCGACRRVLDGLGDDALVRNYFEASCRAAHDTRPLTGDRRVESAGGEVSGPRPSEPAERLAASQWRPFQGSDELLPLRFGRFILREVLGSGGFGMVYRAQDTDLGRDVALKIPHFGGLAPGTRQRFLREGTSAANLHHPHIVQVYQAGTHQGVCFLVSEYCPGRTLRELLDESPRGLEASAAAKIVLALAEAVEHAHASGIVHRDLKPANVILDDRQPHGTLPFCPKLTDFGTARIEGLTQALTVSGTLLGTAPYIAPELLSDGEPAGKASDTYSLGVLLFELVAGRLPIQGTGHADTLHRVLNNDPPPLHKLVPAVPLDLSAICAHCLEKNPRSRYASAQLLADDLRRFLGGDPTVVRPRGAAARMLRWVRRNPFPVTVMAFVCVLFLLIVGGLAWHTSRLGALNTRLLETTRQALTQKERAEQSELYARQLQYASDMRWAEVVWRKGDPESVREVLDRYLPQPGLPELRGLEWYFLKRLTRPDVERIESSPATLYCLRLSPDGRLFATAGREGVIRLHDRATGDVRRSIDSGQGEVNSVAFSPDGRRLASAGDDGSIRVWGVSAGRLLERHAAHDGLAFGVEFTPDGRRMISCGSDGAVHVWRNGTREATYRDHALRVEAIAVSPDGGCWASVGEDRTLIVRLVEDGALKLRWPDAQGKLAAVAFAPDSNRIAVVEAAGDTMSLKLLDLATGNVVFTGPHSEGIHSLAFSPDGDRVLTTDRAGTARIWRLEPGESRPNDLPRAAETWLAHERRAYAGVFEPDGQSVLTAGHEGDVRRWRRPQAKVRYCLEGDELERAVGAIDGLRLHAVAFDADQRSLLIAAHAGILSVPAERTGSPRLLMRRDHTRWSTLAAAQSSGWVACGGSTSAAATADGLDVSAVVRRWEAATGDSRDLWSSTGNASILALSASPSGDTLAVVVEDHASEDRRKQMLLLDADTGQQRWSVPGSGGTRPRFSRDGRWLVFSVQRDIHVVDLHTGQEQTIAQAHSDSLSGLAISPDGRWLATCDEGRKLRIWDFAGLSLHAELHGHQGRISGVVFSPDNRTLLSSSHDGTVRTWSVATGQALLTLHSGDRGVSHLCLAPDGSRLALIEQHQRVWVYDL